MWDRHILKHPMRGAEGAKEQQTPKEEGLCPVNMNSSLQVHLPRSWASSSGSLKEKSEHSFFLFYYYRMEDEAVLDRGASFLKHVCDEEEVEGEFDGPGEVCICIRKSLWIIAPIHGICLIILKLKTQADLWSFISSPHFASAQKVILRTSLDCQNLNQCGPV